MKEIIQYIYRHITWSRKTFGEGERREEIFRHIVLEFDEIKSDPNDIYGWIDIILLAIDGTWRAGFTPKQIVEGLSKKQTINFEREWK